MWTWALIVAGGGALLILLEWYLARKKKSALTWTDKQRLFGIVKITFVLACVAAFLGWALEP